jgi:thiol:disulfide interchange protein
MKINRKQIVSIFISLLLVPVMSLAVFGQFGGDQFGNDQFAGGEPDISTEAKYEEGIILFTLEMEPNYHITDIKNGFFSVKLEKNDYLEIRDVVFPKAVPFEEEMVYQGSVEVKVYIKSLKEISEPVKVKFTVSYQVCQEQPQQMCFAPADETLDVTINQFFKDVKIEKPKEDATVTGNELVDLSGESASAYKPKGGDWVVIILIALVMLAVSLYIGLSQAISEEDGIGAKLGKAAAILLFLVGAFLFLKALDIKSNPAKYSVKPRDAVKLNWLGSIEEGKELAKKENKPLMIDTSAEWCVACQELEEYTFSDPEVAKVLEDYVLVKLDFTKKNEATDKKRKELNVLGMPTVIFMDAEGNEQKRFSGFYPKDKFLAFVGSEGGGWFDRLVELLKKELEAKSLLLFGLVFVLGFLTSLTPCVYPVIPIVMGYIGTRSGKKKIKGFYLSIFFVLGLAFVYSILGVVAAMSGTMMGVSFQNPVVVIVIASIFVIMGLSLAGLFEIPVPSSISSKVQGGGGKSEVIGAVIVGGVSGIIAAPCVGPVLIALLSWVSQTGNIFLGFLLTFIFSLGMGIIFLVVGTFSGVVSAMPKGGKWMDYVKYFFAIILIAGGIYILNAIIAPWVNNLLWGIFLIAVSVLVGLFKALEEYKLKNKLFKFIALVIFLVGVFLFYQSLEQKFFTADSVANLEKPAVQTEIEM